jgi:iron complex transport system permease protein
VPARDRVPARPAQGSTVGRRTGTGSSRRGAADGAPAAARRGGSRSVPAPAPAPADLLVIGPVPLLARVAGALLTLAGLVGAVAPFPTYLVVGGTAVGPVTGPLDALVALVVPGAAIVVGIGLLLGRVPRLGLAYAAVAGALAVGRLLIELYQGHGSTVRPAVEVLAGERVITSSVQTGAGWVLGVVALSLTIVAGVVALLAWGRTVMEDGGSLDPLRPALAGCAVVLGVFAVLCLALPAADVPDRVVTDPTTGLETVVTEQGPRAGAARRAAAGRGAAAVRGHRAVTAAAARRGGRAAGRDRVPAGRGPDRPARRGAQPGRRVDAARHRAAGARAGQRRPHGARLAVAGQPQHPDGGVTRATR